MRKVITTEEYDGEGRLIKRTVTTEDDGQLVPLQPVYPAPIIIPFPQPQPYIPPYSPWPNYPIITCGSSASALQAQTQNTMGVIQ